MRSLATGPITATLLAQAMTYAGFRIAVGEADVTGMTPDDHLAQMASHFLDRVRDLATVMKLEDLRELFGRRELYAGTPDRRPAGRGR